LLVDGEIMATWRARTKGRRLEMTIEPFRRLAGRTRQAIEAEAIRIAPFTGCETVKIDLGT
jgi:DNA glycosylase AlkZ-like